METSNEDGDSELDFWLNMTEAEYLDQMLGPKYLPMKLVIPLTIVYATIFVTGIFGNVATCFVIVKNASMQTATNYYLFSLAISDLTLLVLGERTSVGRWRDFFARSKRKSDACLRARTRSTGTERETRERRTRGKLFERIAPQRAEEIFIQFVDSSNDPLDNDELKVENLTARCVIRSLRFRFVVSRSPVARARALE